MSNAEKFIQDYTSNCFNYNSYAQTPEPWLTPDQARKAVEIERKEIIEKACAWFRTLDELDDKDPYYETTEDFIEGFLKAMEQ